MADPDVFRDIDFVAEHWPHLLDERLKGTKRPWREPQLSPLRRAEADARARAERRERSDVAPGEHPVPMHIDVVDVIVDVVTTADLTAERIAQAAYVPMPLPPASSAFADPRPYLALIRKLWRTARELDESGVCHRASNDLWSLADDVAIALGLVRDGQTLKALCPWCGGRTTQTPLGGALTLRVHETYSGVLVVCHGLVCHGRRCDPPPADCGIAWEGKPAWPQHEWDWLALRLDRNTIPTNEETG